MSSLVSWNWRLDRGALRHCGKCFRKVQHSRHRVYLWSGCYLEPPITWIKDGAYFVVVLISTLATRKTIYTDLVFFTPVCRRLSSLGSGLWLWCSVLWETATTTFSSLWFVVPGSSLGGTLKKEIQVQGLLWLKDSV